MDKKELERAIKTRNLFKAREILVQNLVDYPHDPDFLRECCLLAVNDPLIFHNHDQEYLSMDKNWNPSDFSYLRQRLGKNFSQERYEAAIEMVCYLEKLRLLEAEEAAKEEAKRLQEELLKSKSEQKKQKKLLKSQQREARKLKRRQERNLPRKQILMGAQLSGWMLLYFIIHLIMTEY